MSRFTGRMDKRSLLLTSVASDRSQNTEYRSQNTDGELNRDDDLADLLVGFQILISFHGLRERKCLGDLGVEPAISQAIKDILFRGLQDLGLAPEFHQGIGAQAEAFAKRATRERRRLLGERS